VFQNKPLLSCGPAGYCEAKCVGTYDPSSKWWFYDCEVDPDAVHCNTSFKPFVPDSAACNDDNDSGPDPSKCFGKCSCVRDTVL
jgi:hypothetical protein